MTTPAFVSTSADGLSASDIPLVSAAALIGGLGTQPTMTLPVVAGREPDYDAIWHWLAEPAEFFGIAMPAVDGLRRAMTDITTELLRGTGSAALTVVVADVAGVAQFVVTGTPIEPVRARAVSLATRPGVATPPYWQQMAARTTSRAGLVLAERELASAGHADAVPADGQRIGVPLLGALLCDTPDGRIGLGADRLSRLRAAALLDADIVTDEPVDLAAVRRAWWVSPLFETHPVRAIGECRL
ncbi:hypothetical protein SBI67_11015 [Mycolicibacterium sp. 120266]|uniref:hypothetical protein n=1 Tax=Mycolicibacterium sp. 120266 TaxID=3090601 RepID=UPI00299F3A79|nr:hypothetical protein [Mycolicibacterium sp. 120266]MDX1872654.1 hypothetical protein [Mycolicibacterium sp. 120266]